MENTHATLGEAILYFSELEHCKEFMVGLLWPDGVVRCPTCGITKLT
jgi:Transposase zinc-ribbon domain